MDSDRSEHVSPLVHRCMDQNGEWRTRLQEAPFLFVHSVFRHWLMHERHRLLAGHPVIMLLIDHPEMHCIAASHHL